jgi:PII-like signaling protein
LYQAIVETLCEHGLAGATVLRGIEGFGAHSRLHTHRILRLCEDLPIVIEVADRAERIDAILPTLDAMVTEGMSPSSRSTASPTVPATTRRRRALSPRATVRGPAAGRRSTPAAAALRR